MRKRAGTQLALTNGGGLRDRLPSAYRPADAGMRRIGSPYAPGPPYDLVVGDPYAVLPFGNLLVTRTITGETLHRMLEHSVGRMPSADGRFLQISGFKFTYSLSATAGARVLAVVLDDGTPILANGTSYTVALNDFTNSGGDGYLMVADGGGSFGEVLAQVLLDEIADAGTVVPTTDAGRIIKLP